MITLDDFVAATAASLVSAGTHSTFEGFAHDSRTLLPGECFVAVRGIHGDGHDFMLDAIERGAGAVVIERGRLDAVRATMPDLVPRAQRAGCTVLQVDDTREALRRYAAYILRLWGPTVIGVTGSTGKTTTKEAIADVLSCIAPTFRSWRNYNDLLGLPLSLGRLEPTHQYAVLEMAADHPGEIAELCAIARPQIGVVTNVSATQLQYFSGIDQLSEELATLPAALPPDGLALLNADDARVRAMGATSQARLVWFGLDEAAAHGWRLAPLGSRQPLALTFERSATDESTARAVTFPLFHGDHWAYVILAALAVAEYLGVSGDVAVDVLRAHAPLAGRMRRLEGWDGAVLLDDTQNAAPASVHAGLRTLAAIGQGLHAPKIAVLGDMLRLGDYEAREHRRVGRLAAELADFLVTQGLRAEMIAEEAARTGMPRERIAVTHTAEDAAHAVRIFSSQSHAAVVYVKGSEEMRMEQVTQLLMAHPEHAEHLLVRQAQAWKRVVVMRPDRPTWLEIDLSAIARNTRRIGEIVGPDVRVLVSLKADAYGHGALRVARTVLNNGASWLGVATVSEAEPLRAAGIEAPVLVFGFTPPWQAREAVRLNVRTTIYAMEMAQALSRAAGDLGLPARVHVKVDTGMARLGIRAEDIPGICAFIERLHDLPGIEVEGIFTHFATADSADQSYALRQLERFERVLSALEERGLRPGIVHAANSAALLMLPQARYDMVRPGIAIYGHAPSDEVPLPEGFQPALSFKTQVAQVKDVPAGEGVSYGATYITQHETRIAVLPVGYADGFRRAPANWGEVLIRGQRAPLIGRVCMDQCMVDVTHIPGVRLGDEVVLIGRQGNDELTAESVANRLGTISYEVVSELLARVPRMS